MVSDPPVKKWAAMKRGRRERPRWPMGLDVEAERRGQQHLDRVLGYVISLNDIGIEDCCRILRNIKQITVQSQNIKNISSDLKTFGRRKPEFAILQGRGKLNSGGDILRHQQEIRQSVGLGAKTVKRLSVGRPSSYSVPEGFANASHGMG